MNIETKCVQAGWQPKKGEPRELPIYQSTTFKYDTSEEMGKLFDLEAEGYFYTRLQNPTNDSVAAKICAMEGGVAAMLTSSGQAANFFAVFNICEAGDHLIASSSIYGGTYNLFGTTLKKMGIECTFVDQDLPEEELAKLFKPNTKVVFGETITNPTVSVFDIEKFARLAHSHGVPLIVDNTFATPVNCRPFEFGADIVTHSTTKYMDGHATAVGGCIVDSGNFDWLAHADKYPGLTTPDDSYHGIVYAERFGKAAYITKATSQLMRDLGAIQSPQHAYYLNIGLESLHLRMKKHCENALAVAKYLKNNENVAWVSYPDLEDDKYHELAKKYLPNGSCGVLAFGIKGGREESIKFMDSLKFITIVTHVADARSCILHPASHTHRQMTDEQLIEAGVAPDLIRLSVGIENADDIIADLAQAFEKIQKLYSGVDFMSAYVSAVIVAAGGSVRMGIADSKQFIPLLDKPAIEYTLKAFQKCYLIKEIIIVCREQDVDRINKLVNQNGFTKVSKVVLGGSSRSASVRNGIKAANEKAKYFAIHDGARPLITVDEIERVVEAAFETGAATLGTSVTDTIKIVDGFNKIESTPLRSQLRAVQTPQVFERDLYMFALENAGENSLEFTDDCALIENMGGEVLVVKGSEENIKLTTPVDVILAESILKNRIKNGNC